jgi:replicative DNA helicase
MVELQILSKVLTEKNLSMLTLNNITDDYFITYPDHYQFIKNHVAEYGNVPDSETFLSKFPDFPLVEVTESDKYLIDTFNEEHLYALTVPVLNKVAEYMKTDSHDAVEYLQSQLPNLMQQGTVIGKDIISGAKIRLVEWQQRCKNREKFIIMSGFDELDDITGGWNRGEELVLIFARTGNGKSWVLIKTLEHAWKTGMRVGLIEPEMSATKTGYRFDTLSQNYSNSALTRGYELEGYEAYIERLTSEEIPFFVAGPKDFRGKITVSGLRGFCMANKLDILAIDGINYLTDERRQRGDNRAVALTNISENLMELSIELGIPIIVVAQSNREGAGTGNTPEIENVRDSDGIAHNASIVISIMQKDPGIEMAIKKNRNGKTGDKLTYLWEPDVGNYKFIPSDENEESPRVHEAIETNKQKYKDAKEVF